MTESYEACQAGLKRQQSGNVFVYFACAPGRSLAEKRLHDSALDTCATLIYALYELGYLSLFQRRGVQDDATYYMARIVKRINQAVIRDAERFVRLDRKVLV
jgi:hypothetical protein